RPLVPVEAQPAHVAQDDLLVLRRAPLLIGVLDAQDEGAARPARPEPVEEGGPDAPDVEVSGGRGGEAEPGLACGGWIVEAGGHARASSTIPEGYGAEPGFTGLPPSFQGSLAPRMPPLLRRSPPLPRESSRAPSKET